MFWLNMLDSMYQSASVFILVYFVSSSFFNSTVGIAYIMDAFVICIIFILMNAAISACSWSERFLYAYFTVSGAIDMVSIKWYWITISTCRLSQVKTSYMLVSTVCIGSVYLGLPIALLYTVTVVFCKFVRIS